MLYTRSTWMSIYLSIFFTNFSLYTYHTCVRDFIVHDHVHGRRHHDHRGHHVLDMEQNDFHNYYHYLIDHHNCYYLRHLKNDKLDFYIEKNRGLNLPSSSSHRTTTTSSRLLLWHIVIITTSVIL